MKILSDNTADRILRHLAGDGTPPRAMTPRAAPSSDPARLWQIHVVPATGEVTVDAGRAICEDGWHEVAPSSPGTAEGEEYVVCSIGEDGPAVSLAADLADVSEPFAVIGRVHQGGDSAFYVEQYVSNPIILHRHWGDAEDAEELESWSVAAGKPAILSIEPGDGEGAGTSVKLLVDSRGNIVAWNAGEDPDDPEPPAKDGPPPCGNPLNGTADYNPLDDVSGGGGGGGGKREDEEDYNPLDYEGPGGFTPTCGGEAA